MTWQNFQSLVVPPRPTVAPKRRYSVTSDVLSFQTCSRQYGWFTAKGFVPANPLQFFYGTIIHQVLDRAHAHYKGMLDRSTRGQIPTDQDIETYFQSVQTSLKARGIEPLDPALSDIAKERIKIFNRIEGPLLYPRVRDTEHRLQSDRGNFILHGTVDVLADSPGTLPGMAAEIWDYKGGKVPKKNSDKLRHEFQMLVYAELYRQRNGDYPQKLILYYLGELEVSPPSTTRPPEALREIRLDRTRIQTALQRFDSTVQSIEQCRTANTWPAPSASSIPEAQTCDICDIRWNCPAVARKYPMRVP